MSTNKQYVFRSNIVILIFSIVFALLLGSGLYGFGVDYYAAYHKANLIWGGPFDRLGYSVATLSIAGTHIGVQIVSFILSLSVGLLIRENLRLKHRNYLALFVFLYIIAIHTWPIIMSTSNAMRQGLSMSLIFLALIASSHKNYFWLIICTLIATFMHKSGLLLSVIVLFATYLNSLLTSFSYKNRVVIHFLFGALLLIIFYVSVYYVFDIKKPSKIIEGDFRAAFVLIAFIYVMLSFFYKSIISTPFNLSLYYFSFISPALLMNGLNWEYEKLGMMMLVPYILSIGDLFNKPYNKVYLISTFLLLWLLTIYMGMYDALH